MRFRAQGFAAGLLLVVCHVAAGEERVIRYEKDALTVHLVRVPAVEVLDEIARQTGAEIRGELRNPGEVTAEFENVPLPEALDRLFGDQNFTLVYATDGRLRAVRLLGIPLAPGAQVAAPPPPPPSVVPTGNLLALVANHAPVAVSGHLAGAVGGPTATLQQLAEMGMHHDDATVRSEAMRTLVTTLEVEPPLRAALIGHLNTMDDTALSSMLRGAAGDRAEEIAMSVLTQARASEIRVKASSVLKALRTGG